MFYGSYIEAIHAAIDALPFAKHRQPIFVIADYGLSSERVVFSIDIPFSEETSSAPAEEKMLKTPDAGASET